MQATARLFVALDVAPAVRMAIREGQSLLASYDGSVKWVAAPKLHITLVFLGDVARQHQPAIANALQTVALATPPFTVQLASWGTFPSRRKPSVVWAGISEPQGRLAGLQHAVADALSSYHAREERPYVPHITSGYVRRGTAGDVASELGSDVEHLPPPEPIAWTIDGIILYESVAERGGTTYQPHDHIRLQGTV